MPTKAAVKVPKFYVVWVGRETGIYTNWNQCKAQVENFPAARYKSFLSLSEAKKALTDGWQVYVKPSARTLAGEKRMLAAGPSPVQEALAVDGACAGNPGKMEYRGVIVATGQEIFHGGPFPQGTNNIGEFLALVHGLAYLKQNHLSWVLYSDSVNAISWVRQKKCKTQLKPNPKNVALLELVVRAEKWLQTNDYATKICKWETKMWGEIPADFGRK